MAVYPSRNYGGKNWGSPAGRSVTQFKQAFFDRDAILKSMDRAAHKALSRFGAFVRQRAKTSIRYREAASDPGRPPSAHRSAMSGIRRGNTRKKNQPTSPLRDFIYFAYDRQTKSVIIGPAKTSQVFFDNHRKPVTGTVPEVLEYGGSITILEVLRPGYTVRAGTRGFDGRFRPAGRVEAQWVRADLRSQRRLAGRPTRYRTVTIDARPYMRPSWRAEIGQLAGFFKNSL